MTFLCVREPAYVFVLRGDEWEGSVAEVEFTEAGVILPAAGLESAQCVEVHAVGASLKTDSWVVVDGVSLCDARFLERDGEWDAFFDLEFDGAEPERVWREGTRLWLVAEGKPGVVRLHAKGLSITWLEARIEVVEMLPHGWKGTALPARVSGVDKFN